MQKVLEIIRRIEYAEQGQYVELPFDMPADAERLEVSYMVPPGSIVDLGVRDSARVRGWSGGARAYFELSEESATPGYLAGPLQSGGWAVLLNAYRITEGGCEMKAEVRITGKKPRWLKGELHAHTHHSDGACSIPEAIGLAEAAGLDFLALTDHNTVSQNVTRPRNTELVLIPGMELTTNLGHCNFYGVDQPVDDFRASSTEEVEQYMRTAKQRGAYVSLNHPHCDNCAWLWDFHVSYDWVEIWNGPWRESNMRTLQWWQRQLEEGRRLHAVGGSDFHRSHPYIKHGMPCNWVYSRARTAADILEAVALGHVFLTYAPEGPAMELTCGTVMMGDVCPGNEPVLLTCSGVREGDRIVWVTDRGPEHAVTIHEDMTEWQESHRFDDRLFCRIEIWRRFAEVDLVLPAALTNPIYFQR